MLIPVHPLSRAVLLAELGAEPVQVPRHSFLFDLIAAPPRGRRSSAAPVKDAVLTETIDISIDEKMQHCICSAAAAIGMRLFRFHKTLICLHAESAQQLRGKGIVRPAIRDWLDAHGVDEDAYALDAAYKLYQRYGWEKSKKKPFFCVRKVRKTASNLYAKTEVDAEQIEAAVGAFLSEYRNIMRRVPSRLEKHLRIYLYVSHSGVSLRNAAAALGMRPSSVQRAVISIRRKRAANRTVARLLVECAGLPE